MRPNTILLQLGRFMAEVPRKYLVEPTEEDGRNYSFFAGRIKGWRGSNDYAQALAKEFGITLTPLPQYRDKPLQFLRKTMNMQLAADIAEASHVPDKD